MTHAEKIEIFKEELELITDTKIRRWVEDCLFITPDYTFVISASESYSHHPYWDLGNGGTVRHTRAVVRVASQLIGTLLPQDKSEESASIRSLMTSRVIAACLLHDSAKYGITYDARMLPLHPYIPRVIYGNVAGQLTDDDKNWIFSAIESHMGSYFNGKWSSMDAVTYSNLRKDVLAYLVHQADYLASREDYIDPRFESINKGVDISTLERFEPYPDHIIRGMVVGQLFGMLEDKDVSRLIDNASVDLIASRVKGLRSPAATRRTQYNYDGIMESIKTNISAILDN